MTRIIACISGKGGSGKTTLVANLGAALAEMGKDVVVIDANLTTPNLGLHVGFPIMPITLHDVLKGKAKINDAIYTHHKGLKIIPAGISINDLQGIDARDLPNALLDILGNSEIVLIDASAGLGREALAALESADETLLITNPELPAVMDALKAIKMAENLGTKVTGVVLNRSTRKGHEMTKDEVRNMLDTEIIAEIPEDMSVKQAISKRVPVVYHKPTSYASQEITKLAGRLVGENVVVNRPLHQRLFGFFSR